MLLIASSGAAVHRTEKL